MPVEPELRPCLHGAAVVVVVIDPERCPEPSHALLHQVFGLTRSEARVATGLLCGRSVHDIAAAGGVSIATVRAQTKAVLGKTHTSRQAELVALLTRLAILSEGDTTAAG